MKSKFPRHPDLVLITAEECHALWLAFLAVREEFIGSFPTGIERETAEHFGLGFRFPGVEEAFVPSKRWNAFYLKLIELGIEALPEGENIRLICGCRPDGHRQLLDKIVQKITASQPKK